MARKFIDNLILVKRKRAGAGSAGGVTDEVINRAVAVNKLQNFWTLTAVSAGFACNAVFWVWCLVFAGAPTLHAAFWVGALIGFIAEVALFVWCFVRGIKKRGSPLPVAVFAVSGGLLLIYEICLAVYLGQILNFLLTVVFCISGVLLAGFIGRLVKASAFFADAKSARVKTRVVLLGLFTVIFCILATFCAVFVGSGTSGNGAFKLTRNASYEYSEESGEYTLSRVYYTLGDALGVEYGAPLVLEANVTKNFKTAPLTGVKDGAFDGVKSVTRVDLPESVTSAGALAFKNCAVKELVINSGSFDFNGCLAEAGIQNVKIANGGCNLINAYDESSKTKFTVPKGATDNFRGTYFAFADRFVPELDENELYLNFNDGTHPLAGWNTVIADKRTLLQADGMYRVTVSVPQGFSLLRDGGDRTERLVRLNYNGNSEYLEDGANSVTFMTEDSLDVYCDWSGVYGIEYEGADGYFDSETAQKTYFDNKNGVADAIKLPNASREGYTFYGWYIQDGENRNYVNDNPLNDIDGRDYILHAEFLENYDITLDLKGGTVSGAPDYYHEKSEVTLPVPERSGFTFLGWSKGEEGVTAPQIPYGTHGDIQFTAQWKLDAPVLTAENYSGIYDGLNHSAGVNARHTLAGVAFAYAWNDGGTNRDFSVKNTADSIQKTCTVTASFDGYTSDGVSIAVSAQVSPKRVSAVWSGSSFTYTGSAHTVSAVLDGLADGESLSPALQGNSQVNAGHYTARAEISNGNYTLDAQSAAHAFDITPANYNMDAIAFASASIPYDGNTHSLSISGTLPTGADGVQVEVSYSRTNMVNAGEYSVTASFTTASGNYNAPQSRTATLNITKIDYDMTGVRFNGKSMIYDGQPHSLEVEGELPAGADGVRVTVSYSGFATNVADGERTVTARFATASINYNTPAEMTATIKITPANYDMTGVRLDGKTVIYDGQAHSLEVAGLRAGADGTMPSVSYSRSGLTEADDYGITASFTSVSQNYNAPSETYTAQLKISPAEYDMTGVRFNGKTVIYDGQAHSLEIEGELPAGADGVRVTVSYSGSATAVGTQKVVAKFTTASKNYNAPADMEADITVTPATIIAEIGAYSGVYKDGESLIVNVNVTTAGGAGYKIVYSLEQNGEYSETAPVMSGNVYNYTVWYKITADNHEELTGSTEITAEEPEPEIPDTPEEEEND